MTPAQRDALLSSLTGRPWPHAPLLDAVPVPPASGVLDVGGETAAC